MPFPSSPPQVDASFPPKLECLFQPRRTKVLWGGRGAGRSWGVARALLILGTKTPIRILCVREFQNSIVESVHKLLSDQIDNLQLGLGQAGNFYEIQKARIIGANGTSISFEGIKNNTARIKSYEGIDICWVEEANKVSRTSWGILIPTIRKAGSEIWMTFNPELETDYTYKRFVLEPSDDSTVVHMNWRDNPWFPEVLRTEMEDLRKRDYDAYLNVWEGHPVQMLEGVVFAKQLRQAKEDDRFTSVPWDPEVPVDTFWDLGRRDLTCIWFIQRVAMQYRVLNYFEDSQEDITYYLKHLQSLPYVYGCAYQPHDAAAKRIGEKRTIEQITRGMGFRVSVVPRISRKVNAINAARIMFPQCWFDAEACAEGIDRLRHYRYQVVDENGRKITNGRIEDASEGQLSLEPLHDENSNAADAFMTFAQSIKSPVAKGAVRDRLDRVKTKLGFQVSEAGGLGWMG